jgi:hypothetical protein
MKRLGTTGGGACARRTSGVTPAMEASQQPAAASLAAEILRFALNDTRCAWISGSVISGDRDPSLVAWDDTAGDRLPATMFLAAEILHFVLDDTR